MKSPSQKPPGPARESKRKGLVRTLGLGLVTGACDDDPSAIGTYASAGAKFGFSLLWTAPITFPMMYVVVYLSSKLGQATGKGLFQILKENHSSKILWPTLIGVMIGNTIEAGADLGGMAAAIQLFIPLPLQVLVGAEALMIVGLQCLGSYETIRNIFRWLALVLLAYVGAAILARPNWQDVLRGTLIPTLQFDRDFLSMLVALVGTTLSAYLYSWQSNVEVEEAIAKRDMSVGVTSEELQSSKRDILSGMLFSNVIMYFIILASAASLHTAGRTDIETAAQAAEALQPIAGSLASALFAIGIIGVGFLAVPVMTAGGAYDLCQAMGWKASLHARPGEAKHFYATIVGISAAAVALNFLGINPMKALVWSGIVQGFSTPPLLLLIMLMTNDPKIVGDKVNSWWTNLLGWTTVLAIFATSAALIVSWFL
jgi:Mn2+/Fe2+ NRAMP family transporter